MIVGADAASDARHRRQASRCTTAYGLRRVYYSAFSPIPDASAVLPLKRAAADARASALPGRLADALLRLRARGGAERADANGMLPLDIDPKLAWALKPASSFPVDVNRAPREMLLRVPGPRHQGGRPHPVLAPLAQAGARRCRSADPSIAKVRPFIVAADWRPTLLIDRADLRARLGPRPQQLELFAA